MSQFDGFWKHQNKPACAETVKSLHTEVEHYTEEEERELQQKGIDSGGEKWFGWGYKEGITYMCVRHGSLFTVAVF